jgi:hypothetical protein
MALFSRRPRPSDPDDSDDFDDFDDAPAAPRPTGKNLRPIQLRDWEIPAGYAVAALVALFAILELVVTKGKGAPKTHSPLLPIAALVIAAAQAATIRLGNRLVTGVLGVLGGLAVSYQKVPDSLSILHSIGFVGPFAYAFLVTQRHSRAQRALRGPRRPGQGGGSTRRGSKATNEPSGVRPNRRYTPPKPKEERTRGR